MMQTKISGYWTVGALIISWFLFVPAARAEQVVALKPDGVIKLNDGRAVRLAGVELSPESTSLLAVLLGGREVEIEELPEDGIKTVPGPVFVYVKTSEIPKPHPVEIKAHEKKMMVNELLLQLGSAKMIENECGKHCGDFEKAQSEARSKGHGIWSYEEHEQPPSGPGTINQGPGPDPGALH